MDTELKNKWCDALRSGEYQQGRWALRDDNGRYCCLGVLAIIADLPISENGLQILVNGKGADYMPIRALVGDNTRELMSKNDHGASFSEIADYVEAHL